MGRRISEEVDERIHVDGTGCIHPAPAASRRAPSGSSFCVIQELRQRRLPSRIADTPDRADRFDRRSARRARRIDQRQEQRDGGSVLEIPEPFDGKCARTAPSVRASDRRAGRRARPRCAAMRTRPATSAREASPPASNTAAASARSRLQTRQRVDPEPNASAGSPRSGRLVVGRNRRSGTRMGRNEVPDDRRRRRVARLTRAPRLHVRQREATRHPRRYEGLNRRCVAGSPSANAAICRTSASVSDSSSLTRRRRLRAIRPGLRRSRRDGGCAPLHRSGGGSNLAAGAVRQDAALPLRQRGGITTTGTSRRMRRFSSRTIDDIFRQTTRPGAQARRGCAPAVMTARSAKRCVERSSCTCEASEAS